MKLLKCKLCHGECDIVGGERSIFKKIKCTKCGFSSEKENNNKSPEIVISLNRRKLPPGEV